MIIGKPFFNAYSCFTGLPYMVRQALLGYAREIDFRFRPGVSSQVVFAVGAYGPCLLVVPDKGGRPAVVLYVFGISGHRKGLYAPGGGKAVGGR